MSRLFLVPRLAGPRPSRVISAGPGGRGLEADRIGNLDASLRLPWPPLLAGDAPAAPAAVRAAVAGLLVRCRVARAAARRRCTGS